MNVEFTDYDYKIKNVSQRFVITFKFSNDVLGNNCCRMTRFIKNTNFVSLTKRQRSGGNDRIISYLFLAQLHKWCISHQCQQMWVRG